MSKDTDRNTIFKKSEKIIGRQIEDELILVPIESETADLNDSLFTLNKTGIDIWNRLDGTKDLHTIIKELLQIYDGPEEIIVRDVTGIVQELSKFGIIKEVQ